jgi:UDP-N-acetylmuramate: L-alanyl-gamma-D-glutamyl-meso-diaminopimelate ligase
MSASKNGIPANVRRIHLIAVCGTGMGALACMLKRQGFDISGSDQKIYPPMSDFLREQKIHIMDGFAAAHLSDRPDLVIVGNAVTRENPEVKQMMQMGIPYCSMPQALNRFFAEGKKGLLVAGTHGKTTTASLLAWMLYKGGMDPSYMIGGILQNFDSNYRLGNGDPIIIEGDEYDTAFFDKGPKLMHFHPAIAVLTSVEFDHADIFRDLEHVKAIFSRFLKQLEPSSLLLAFDADENIRRIISSANCRVEFYGSDENSKWRLGEIQIDAPWSGFEVLRSGQPYDHFKTRMVGRHNLNNALAVVAIADELGLSTTEIGVALETFEGVKRRQQIRGCKNQITVMDDFAHHPTAVRETVAAVKSFHAPRRLIAVFEPRTNSSMRDIFQDVYPLCFDPADLICIRQPPLLEKIPIAERFSSQKLVADLKQRGKDAHFFADTDAIVEFLGRHAVPGDLILVMSNGGFDNIHQKLLDRL